MRAYIQHHPEYKVLCIESDNDTDQNVLVRIFEVLKLYGLVKGTQLRPGFPFKRDRVDDDTVVGT